MNLSYVNINGVYVFLKKYNVFVRECYLLESRYQLTFFEKYMKIHSIPRYNWVTFHIVFLIGYCGF